MPLTRIKNKALSDLLDANGDVVSGALDNVPASDNASALVTGTIPDARLSNQVKQVKSGSAPGSPEAGDLWFDTSTNILKNYDGSTWIKVAAVTPTLTGVTGAINVGEASNLTLAGTNFLTSGLVVNFLQSTRSVDVDVTVTPSSETAATVAVPSSVYNNVQGGDAVTIKVTNSDGVASNTQNTTAVAQATGGTITSSGG